MIKVNLLPGAGGKSEGASAFDFGALLSGATAGIKDKFLIGAIASVGIVGATVAVLFIGQQARERTLVERERRAMEDSTRYKVVLAAKSNAEATRDSLYQQVAIIKSIDDSRYLWPHLLDEISGALPPYTWLTSVTQTSLPPSSAASDSAQAAKAATAAAKGVKPRVADAKTRRARADSVLAVASRSTKFRIIGHTVDIQALTLLSSRCRSPWEETDMAIGANLTKRDQLLVAVSVLAFAVAGVYGYFFYLPKSDDLEAIQQHVEGLDKRNAQAKADIANGSLQKLRLEAAQFAAELTVLRQIVPTTNEVPALLENVSTAARRVGLDLSSVEPMPVLVGEQFDTYRYKLSVTGGYHAIASFLTNVGSLNRIIAPVALTLKPLSSADQKKIRIQKKDESLLDSDFQIQTYIAHASDPVEAMAEEKRQ